MELTFTRTRFLAQRLHGCYNKRVGYIRVTSNGCGLLPARRAALTGGR